MIQTQFAHTITVPDEWEHEGHTYQVIQDEWAECPTEWLDSADAVDDLHKPITVLGRTLKASDIAREMLSDDWEGYVNSCIAHLIAMEEIKEVH